MNKIILSLLTASNLLKCVALTFAVSVLVACCGVVNTTGSKFFTEDGMCNEKLKTFVSLPPKT